MTPFSVLLALASAAFAVGGLCMKWSAGLTRVWPSVCVFVLFCTGAGLQAIALRRTELGVGYILVLGGEVVLTLAFSVFVLGEGCSAARISAVALIVIGMVWLHGT
jgi:multidrug transporter EmrE-like cation transporter